MGSENVRFIIPWKVVMIPCQFMLLKMIIRTMNLHPPSPMMLRRYRNEINIQSFLVSRNFESNNLDQKWTNIISKKGFSVSPKSRKRRKSATKKKIVCTGRGCRCGTAFATRKLLLAHYVEKQCYKCKKCEISFQSGRKKF